MFDFFAKIIGWILSLWSGIPESIKSKIISLIVDSFESLLRAFFRENKGEEKA